MLRCRPPTSGAQPSTRPSTCCAAGSFVRTRFTTIRRRTLPSSPLLLLKERLRRAIAALDSDDASLFLLRHVEGLSIEELAEMFEIEKNNVAVRLHRIRRSGCKPKWNARDGGTWERTVRNDVRRPLERAYKK